MRILVALVMLAAVGCGSAGPSPVGTPLSEAQLKFAVMDSAGKPVWCDPDFYPVARAGGEEASAIARYPEIKGDAALYSAIVAHEHLPAGDLPDAQKLLLYRAWKLLGALKLTKDGDRYSFEYTVHSQSAGYERVAGSVRVDGVVTVDSRSPTGAPNCPICLASSTLISTPEGMIPVTEVRVGTIVWTEAADGSRVAAPVVEIGGMDAPRGHRMVHLVLADRRDLLASPGHPTADGRAIGALKVGDSLDGSTIVRRELVPYGGDRTYDLLPAGPTGHYWANGILLASTIAD
jgi:hypothetical protein